MKDQNARRVHLPEYIHIAFTVAQQDFETIRERIFKSGVNERQENWTEGDSFYFVDPH